MKNEVFRFRPDKKGLFLDVIYAGETEPRYFIDVRKKSCSCKGWAIRTNCKHLKLYLDQLGQIARGMDMRKQSGIGLIK